MSNLICNTLIILCTSSFTFIEAAEAAPRRNKKVRNLYRVKKSYATEERIMKDGGLFWCARNGCQGEQRAEEKTYLKDLIIGVDQCDVISWATKVTVFTVKNPRCRLPSGLGLDQAGVLDFFIRSYLQFESLSLGVPEGWKDCKILVTLLFLPS